MLGQRQVCGGDLFEKRRTLVPRVPEAPHAQRRAQRSGDAMPHRVGQGHVQDVPGQTEVEGVPGDAGCRLQPARQPESPRLAGLRPGKQSMLDLRRQAQRARALTPLVQVGVPPVGDHHEGEQVCELSHLRHRLAFGFGREQELQETDHLAAFRDRGEHPPLVGMSGLGVLSAWRKDLHLLRPHGLFLRPSVEGQHRRPFLDVAAFTHRQRHLACAPLLRRKGYVRQTDQPTSRKIGDEKGHRRGAERQPERTRHRLDRLDRRSVLRRVQHAAYRSDTASAHHFRSIGGSPSGVSHASGRRCACRTA